MLQYTRTNAHQGAALCIRVEKSNFTASLLKFEEGGETLPNSRRTFDAAAYHRGELMTRVPLIANVPRTTRDSSLLVLCSEETHYTRLESISSKKCQSTYYFSLVSLNNTGNISGTNWVSVIKRHFGPLARESKLALGTL